MKSEFLAGLTTFATMAYIVVVNPQILSQAGLDFESVMLATIISSAIATLMMGLYANYPFAVAPGMGLNAYFTYGIVLGEGFSWQSALAICFLSGIFVLTLNLLGLRHRVVNAIPQSIRYAATAGIGLFLIFIGFQNIDLITSHEETMVTLGSLNTPSVILAGLGIIIATALLSHRFSSALLVTILALTAIAWSVGITSIHEWIAVPNFNSATAFELDLSVVFTPAAWPIIFTFVFFAMFDTAGTVYALAEQGGFVRNQKVPGIKRILTCDAMGTIAGGLLGTSPHTPYLESASGIAAGGRTGKTAIVISLLLLSTLFFSPLIEAIPLFATAPALMVVGALMLRSLQKINWEDPTETIPATIVTSAIPLSYSVADGIALGFVTYPIIKLLSGRVSETHPLLWAIAACFIIKFVAL